jgi:hypothetical protein
VNVDSDSVVGSLVLFVVVVLGARCVGCIPSKACARARVTFFGVQVKFQRRLEARTSLCCRLSSYRGEFESKSARESRLRAFTSERKDSTQAILAAAVGVAQI